MACLAWERDCRGPLALTPPTPILFGLSVAQEQPGSHRATREGRRRLRVKSLWTDLREQKIYGNIEQVHICIHRSRRAETGQMNPVTHWPHQSGLQPRCQQSGRVKNIAERPPRTRGQHKSSTQANLPLPLPQTCTWRCGGAGQGWGVAGGPRGGGGTKRRYTQRAGNSPGRNLDWIFIQKRLNNFNKTMLKWKTLVFL